MIIGSGNRNRRFIGPGGTAASSGPYVPPVPTDMTWSDATGTEWSGPTNIQWSNAASYPGLTRWKTARNNVVAGTGQAVILYCGDSITFSAGSSGSLTSGDMITNNYTTKLTALLNTGGYPAQCNNLLANGGNGAVNHSNNDPRETYSGGFLQGNSNLISPGGFNLSHASAPGTGYSITLSGIDTFRLRYPLIGTNTATPGGLTYQVDGGSTQTISLSSGGAADGTPVALDIACGSVGTHTLALNASSSNLFFILGVEGIDSTSHQIRVLNAGWTASKTSDWLTATHPWSPFNYLGSFGADAIVFALITNDIIASVPVATAIANLRSLTTQAKASGADVAWQTPPPLQTTLVSQSVQDQYLSAMRSAAQTDGIALVDVNSYFGSWTVANSNGWMFDSAHPNAAGYAIIGQLNYNVLTA